ncbi:MAG: tyrosine-type recombinase/integrase [Lysobacter sp.]
MNITPIRPRPAEGIPGDLPTIIVQYLQHRTLRGAALNTVKAYGDDLRRLTAYLARYDVTLVQLVSERLLNRWIDDGLLHHKWSRRTAARRLSAARAFLQWARGEGYVDHDAAAHVHIRFRPRQVIAPELDPLKRVVAAIGTDDALDLRDRAILMLLLDAALRSSEVALLDAFDPMQPRPVYCVDTDRSRVYVRPKGADHDDETEVLGIEPQTVAAVQAWTDRREAIARPGVPALFVNLLGTRFSRQSLYVMVRNRGAAVGLPRLHPHLFRHRRVGDVTERLGIDAGCALARHKQRSTTVNVYGAHAAEVQRAAIRNLCPLGEVSP